GEGARADVRRRDIRRRAFKREGDGYGTRSCSQIQNTEHGGIPLPYAVADQLFAHLEKPKRDLHQQFGFGPGNQYIRRYTEITAHELAAAQNIGHRLAMQPALLQLTEP